MAPPMGSSPLVVTRETTPFRQAGWRQDPPVSSQTEQATRLAPTDSGAFELEPPVSRVVS